MTVYIFTGGESPDLQDAGKFFQRNENADYVVCADSGLDTYEEYFSNGITKRRPDFLTGDFDSVKNRNILDAYKDVEQKIYSHDKDYTDSELALMKAREVAGKDGTVVLVGGNGGRSDHFLALFDTFARDYHADIWLCGPQIMYLLEKGDSAQISNVVPDDRISISRIPSEYESTQMDCMGLEWPVIFPRGFASLSNRISREFYDSGQKIMLNARSGSFLIFVPFHADVEITKVQPRS